MEKESEPSQAQQQQPAAEEPVNSIEGDGKGEENKTEVSVAQKIPDGLWRIMMDVVLSIYEVREEE